MYAYETTGAIFRIRPDRKVSAIRRRALQALAVGTLGTLAFAGVEFVSSRIEPVRVPSGANISYNENGVSITVPMSQVSQVSCGGIDYLVGSSPNQRQVHHGASDATVECTGINEDYPVHKIQLAEGASQTP